MKKYFLTFVTRLFLLRSTYTAAFSANTPTNNALVDKYTPPDLSSRVAIVTGGSRGIGKGIALELGRAGMTVYIASRSSRSGSISTERDLGLQECTVERTAEEIDNMSGKGKGIAIPMDVSNDVEIAELIQKVKAECGRLDVLICSAFTTPPNLTDASFRDEFWKQDSGSGAMWDACHGVGLRGAYMACCESVPLMIDTAKEYGTRPLIGIISSFGGKSYTFNVAYGVGKAAADRLASDMSVQLSKYNVDTVALYPGLVKTEGNIEMEKRGEWEEASGGFDLQMGETPRFSGRAVALLMANSELMKERSGKVVVVAELAKELAFTDEEGRLPPSIRSLRFILPNFVFPKIEKESGSSLPSWITDNVPDYLLPWSTFSGGPPPNID